MRLLAFGFTSGVVLFLAGSAIAGYFLWQAARDLPDYDVLAKYEPPVMTRIHAHDGALIAEYARQRRIFVPVNTIPKLVLQAFLSAEDKRFYSHGGLDFRGIGRAIIVNLQNIGKGRRPQGASTITQQVAKNFLLSDLLKKKTKKAEYERKLKEAILALRIESTFPKDRILELYLNEIYLGIGSYGVAAAALNYFSKELKDVTIEEAAYLAALPKAPNNYHPFRKTRAATIRRNWVLSEMNQNGFITPEEAAAAKAKPLTVNLRTFGAHIFAAEFFAEEVRRALLAQYGEKKLYGGGLSVRTTLDPELQKMARQALMDGLSSFDRGKGWRGPVQKLDISGDWGVGLTKIDSLGDIHPWQLGVVLEMTNKKAVIGLKPKREKQGKLSKTREAVEVPFSQMKWARRPKGRSPRKVGDVVALGDVVYVVPKDPAKREGVWSLRQIPEVGGGIVVIDPHTGRVLALVGGFSFDASQFDRAVQAKRQPGSAFKPFVYTTALDNGYKPTSVILDAPISIEQGPGRDVWEPKNYGGKYYGPSTLRVGLERSRNLMTVRLAQDMGMPLIAHYASRFGIYDSMMPVLSMALGAGETTLLRLSTGYGMLANGGKEIRPTLIDRIQDRWGRTIWRHDTRTCNACNFDSWQGQKEPEVPDDRKQIIDPHTAYQIVSMLEGVVQRGTGRSLRKLGFPLAGKTGTTNDEKDAWFVGFTPDLVVGVFVGYDTPRPMGKGSTGGHVAAPIVGNFLKMARAGKAPIPFRIPPGIKLVRVSVKTGLRVTSGGADVVLEAFKPNEGPDDEYSILGFEHQGGLIQPQGERGGVRSGRRRVY